TDGHSCQQVADLLGEDRRTVQRWVTRFETHGLTGLRDGTRSGRPATLNTTQWAALGRDLRHEPQKFGHAVSVCVQAIQSLMKNFSWPLHDSIM
ncbi:MAG TPA: helix-turn-helix domain-containing protein, partial [Nitrospiraceae bacterium]|nr:helix-turn-helix domain-containing protein [Nitrospiraceae bacterium]